MTTLLHINSSAQLSQRSYTRMLGQRFMQRWQAAEPDVTIIDRDVAADPIPVVDRGWIAAAFTKPEDRTPEMHAALVQSDTLIDEVIAADILVMGAPMYNYGVPAALKAWIDKVARIGRTFSFDLSRGDVPIEPMLGGKRLVILSSRGEFGFEPGGMREHMNALDPAIKACAHYWGVAQEAIDTVTIEYQEFKDARHDRSVAEAKDAVDVLVDHLLAGYAPGSEVEAKRVAS